MPPTRPARSRLIAVLTGIVLGTVVLDQVTKALAVLTLEGLPRTGPGPAVPVIGDLAGFTFHRNPGAAFGMGAGSTWIFSLFALVVLVVVIVLLRRLAHGGWALGLGLLLGGLLGNLIDRLVRPPGFLHGAVVDFIDLRVFICNVADIAITGAAITMIWLSIRGIGIDGSREGARRERDADGAGEGPAEDTGAGPAAKEGTT